MTLFDSYSRIFIREQLVKCQMNGPQNNVIMKSLETEMPVVQTGQKKLNQSQRKRKGIQRNKKAKEINGEEISKGKRQPTEWENILTNHISNKGLISKIDKEHIQLKIKNKKTQLNGHRI